MLITYSNKYKQKFALYSLHLNIEIMSNINVCIQLHYGTFISYKIASLRNDFVLN